MFWGRKTNEVTIEVVVATFISGFVPRLSLWIRWLPWQLADCELGIA